MGIQLLHKSKDFSTNNSNLFFKVLEVSIQKVIGFGCVCIHKGKLIGRSLKAFEIWNKPNLDKIFKSYLRYCDLERLHTSPNYLESLQKKLFAMIRQVGPPTLFVTFTSIEKSWDPLIKALHTLHVKKLNFSKKLKTSNLFI